MRIFFIAVLLIFCSFDLSAQSGCKCCSDEYRQFDFWIGRWEAFGPKGKLAGTNVIDIIQDSCIIRENWKSATGAYTGTSYNFYDSNSNMWTQTWIDNQGGSLILKGNYDNNKMILSSEPIKNSEGTLVTNKITWTKNDDGTVQQLWESKIENEDWTVAFDGLYKKMISDN